jgi:hypothetical protein
LSRRLSEEERRLGEHLHQWARTEEHPLVIQSRKQIEQLQIQIEETEPEVPGQTEFALNQSRIDAQKEIQGFAGMIRALERQRETVESRIEQLKILDRDFLMERDRHQTMQRQLTEARNRARFWDAHLQNTTIALTAEMGNRGVRLSIGQRADVDQRSRPSKPDIMTVTGLAVMAGLGVGVGLILLAELLNQSFRSVEQASDELKLPVLGAVNEITTPQQALRRKLLTWGVYPPLAVLMILVLIASYVLANMSLQTPHQFEQLVNRPGQYFTETFSGRR